LGGTIIGLDYLLASAPTILIAYLTTLAACGLLLSGNGRQRWRVWIVIAIAGGVAAEAYMRLTWDGGRGQAASGASISMVSARVDSSSVFVHVYCINRPRPQPDPLAIARPPLPLLRQPPHHLVPRARFLSVDPRASPTRHVDHRGTGSRGDHEPGRGCVAEAESSQYRQDGGLARGPVAKRGALCPGIVLSSLSLFFSLLCLPTLPSREAGVPSLCGIPFFAETLRSAQVTDFWTSASTESRLARSDPVIVSALETRLRRRTSSGPGPSETFAAWVEEATALPAANAAAGTRHRQGPGPGPKREGATARRRRRSSTGGGEDDQDVKKQQQQRTGNTPDGAGMRAEASPAAAAPPTAD
jgi:hypothetical protein